MTSTSNLQSDYEDSALLDIVLPWTKVPLRVRASKVGSDTIPFTMLIVLGSTIGGALAVVNELVLRSTIPEAQDLKLFQIRPSVALGPTFNSAITPPRNHSSSSFLHPGSLPCTYPRATNAPSSFISPSTRTPSSHLGQKPPSTDSRIIEAIASCKLS